MGARYFGAEVLRGEDRPLITGEGQYVDDIRLPGTLHGAYVRSPHAHALIKSIDTSEALALDGVHAVFTFSDLDEPINRPATQTYPSPLIKQDLRPFPLAKEEVCYVGETIAFIVADTRHIAEDAIPLVAIEFDILEPVVRLRDAVKDTSPRAHITSPDNIASQMTVSYGDVKNTFKNADHLLETKFLQHRGGCHAMEGRAVLANYNSALDELTVWSATQCPYLIRRSLATQFEMSESRIRVIAPDVGGGFGPKAGFYVEEIIVPWASRKLGRPVKWTEDRREHFISTNTQRDTWWELEIAASKEGRVLGVRGKIILDNGAYIPYGLLLAFTTVTPLPGPYKVLALDITQEVVFTNTVTNSPVRGAGRPNAAYAMERVIETVARHLNIERDEIRRRNFVNKDDFPYQTGLIHFNGRPMTYDSGDYHSLLEKALELADYSGFSRRQKEARKEGRFLGIGISSCIEDTGVGPYEGVTIRVDPLGKIYVSSGAASQGQGHKTILRQIVADELHVDIDDIHVEIGDTAKFPQGVGTVASRVGVNIGTAAFAAATNVRKKALSLAAEILETECENLEIEDGIIRDKGKSNTTISLGELALKLAPMSGGAIPDGHTASLESTSYDSSKGLAHASGSNVCELEVDTGTGEVKLLNYSVAHDCGKKINPLIVEGQIIGGVVHGIGNALFEEMIYDDNGQPQTTNYGEYLLPLATEMPPINIVHQETASPLNPLGLKGAGEGGTIPAAGAIVAAIENALQEFDVVIDRYPVTPQYLCDLIDSGAQTVTTPIPEEL
jgi:carbon-monoxide dehydrogenase large subunit